MCRYFELPTWDEALLLILFKFIGAALSCASVAWGANLIAVHYEDVLAVGRGPAIMSIIVGVCAALLHWCECLSDMKKSSFVMNFVGSILLLLVIAEFTIGGFAFKYSNQLEDVTIEQFQSKIKEVEDGKMPELKENMDNFQIKMQCCGAFNASDWLQIPDSCFADQKQRKDIYTEGCVHAIKIVLAPTMEQLAIFVTALACLQIFIMLIFIVNYVRYHYERAEYEPV
ncbi:tetraspanin-5 [Tetranychus urticae]|uniref:Tetraspanin n=1 Tax=Tetranychus urticae TaxID=32264 RepID=T1KS35_TETUR|nr:tetraspanin-5 [Tetranychus urticae]